MFNDRILLDIKNYFNSRRAGQELDNNIYEAFKYLDKDSIRELYKKGVIDRYDLCHMSDVNNSALVLMNELFTDITNEDVLCVDRDNIVNVGDGELDVTPGYEGVIGISSLLKCEKKLLKLLNRRLVEYNESYVQLIPYCVVYDKDRNIVLLEKKKGDNRLVGTIDFPAGHSNSKNIIEAAHNELKEELGLPKGKIKTSTITEVIPDNNNVESPSHYHKGILILVEIDSVSILDNLESDKHNLVIKNLNDSLDMETLARMGHWCSWTYSYLRDIKL